MYLVTCGTLLVSLLFFTSLLLTLSSPLGLMLVFFSLVVFNTFFLFILSSDFFPYMLYLVYVGGLLVLMVYMVVISTNYQIGSTSYGGLTMMGVISFLLTMFLYIHNPTYLFLSSKSVLSSGSLELHAGALIMLVLLLLYTFMYVCESVRLGGRALRVGKG